MEIKNLLKQFCPPLRLNKHMKKLPLSLALLSILATPLAHAEDLEQFSDVSEAHPNNAAIYHLHETGVINGYEDGSFQPEREVSRAEAVKILLKGLDLAVDESSASALEFTDVTEEDWFVLEVGTAFDRGLVKGYEDGEFKPHNTVNRAEAVKMLLSAAELEFEEAEVWYEPYMDYALEWNIAPLQTDGDWHADAPVTRGEISEMVLRMQHVDRHESVFPESEYWLNVDLDSVNINAAVPFGWSHSDGSVSAIWLLDETDGVSVFEPGSNGASLIFTPASGDVTEGELLVLADGSTLQVIQTMGEGAYAERATELMELVLGSVGFVPDSPAPSTDDILAEIRSNIRVDGKGQASIDLVDDWQLVETDAIGVGTGPIDYFYSPSLNHTLKYERSFDVVMDIAEGSTSAF